MTEEASETIASDIRHPKGEHRGIVLRDTILVGARCPCLCVYYLLSLLFSFPLTPQSLPSLNSVRCYRMKIVPLQKPANKYKSRVSDFVSLFTDADLRLVLDRCHLCSIEYPPLVFSMYLRVFPPTSRCEGTLYVCTSRWTT